MCVSPRVDVASVMSGSCLTGVLVDEIKGWCSACTGCTLDAWQCRAFKNRHVALEQMEQMSVLCSRLAVHAMEHALGFFFFGGGLPTVVQFPFGCCWCFMMCQHSGLSLARLRHKNTSVWFLGKDHGLGLSTCCTSTADSALGNRQPRWQKRVNEYKRWRKY